MPIGAVTSDLDDVPDDQGQNIRLVEDACGNELVAIHQADIHG
jgi:hypothetical protein